EKCSPPGNPHRDHCDHTTPRRCEPRWSAARWTNAFRSFVCFATAHANRHKLAIVQAELGCNLQSISAYIEAVCRKTLQHEKPGLEQSSDLKNSVKNYMSPKTGGRQLVSATALVRC